MAEAESKSELEVLKTSKCFGGTVTKYRHESTSTRTPMTFTVFLPDSANESNRVPILYFLSGLTCTDENFITKAGAPRVAAAKGIALVCPDTSPRGANIEGEDESWDFGTGAGFYVNATEEPWSANYKMYTYVTEELPALLAAELPLDVSNASVTGHSMGGHGALVVGLKNPAKYKSVSAFAPICHPSSCPWGVKAFTGYLGTDEAAWEPYDATLLMQASAKYPNSILIDQGTDDSFYTGKQLLPEAFLGACKAVGFDKLTLRMQEGYDHSYYFIATFIEDHINFHAKALVGDAEAAVEAGASARRP